MPTELADSIKWNERRIAQPRRQVDFRPDDERDRSRLIHSAAFRRLQAKTQVLGIGESDFHRTRLTHTMEVAQIGRGIVLQLQSNRVWADYGTILPSTAQIESMSFAHDLGHPPFGHSGEVALNHAMREHGGFEGNGQSLRIVSLLEPHTLGNGLNLTRRVLLGILKYPVSYSLVRRKALPPTNGVPTKEWKPPKCYLETEGPCVDWILDAFGSKDLKAFQTPTVSATEKEHGKSGYKSFDCSILELADDIAYGIHDLEDGISLGLISEDSLSDAIRPSSLEWAGRFGVKYTGLIDELFGDNSRRGTRKLGVGSLINALIGAVEIRENNLFAHPLLKHEVKLPKEPRKFLDSVCSLVFNVIVGSHEVQTLEYRGRKIIADMFGALTSDPKVLLGDTGRRRLNDGEDMHRIVCDFIAGMTDVYANRFYERLFGSRQASVFERL